MRVLAVTKVFPSAAAPLDAPHIRQQCRALAKRCDVEVLAAIPWFPGAGWVGRYSAAGRVAAAPAEEVIDGLRVIHPRFFFVPKIGLPLQGPLYAASLAPWVLRLRDRFDVILATWAHPDGVAATMLGRALGKPVVVQVIGSDINVLGQRVGARLPMRLALPHADRLIAVSRQLAAGLEELGVSRERIDVIPTGVNVELFHPRPRQAARDALPTLPPCRRLAVYVGRLEVEKGVLDLLSAFAALPASMGLAIIGDGAARGAVEARARALGSRVEVLGNRPLEEIPRWLAAADVLVLPSWAEGTPNVILEALACGRRVVATNVGGIPDVITDDRLGALVSPRDVGGLRAALETALDADYDAEAVRAAAPLLTWDESAARVHACLERAMG